MYHTEFLCVLVLLSASQIVIIDDRVFPNNRVVMLYKTQTNSYKDFKESVFFTCLSHQQSNQSNFSQLTLSNSQLSNNYHTYAENR